MFRPFHVLTFSLVGLSLTVVGCRTSTPYTRLYSPRKSYYVAPAPKLEKSAEELLTVTEDASLQAPTGGLPPADPNAVPGLPPAALPTTPPAADPLAPAPAAPAN